MPTVLHVPVQRNISPMKSLPWWGGAFSQQQEAGKRCRVEVDVSFDTEPRLCQMQ